MILFSTKNKRNFFQKSETLAAPAHRGHVAQTRLTHNQPGTRGLVIFISITFSGPVSLSRPAFHLTHYSYRSCNCNGRSSPQLSHAFVWNRYIASRPRSRRGVYPSQTSLLRFVCGVLFHYILEIPYFTHDRRHPSSICVWCLVSSTPILPPSSSV